MAAVVVKKKQSNNSSGNTVEREVRGKRREKLCVWDERGVRGRGVKWASLG